MRLVHTLLTFALFATPAYADRIAVTVRGHGPDVILIPGLLSSSAVWDGLAKRLETSHRLHIVQVMGFAGTKVGDNASGAVIAPVVEDIHAYIESRHLNAPAVIGHSMGGLLGLELTARHPGDAGRLMIVDSLPFFGVLMGAQDTASVEPQAAKLRDGMIVAPADGFAKREEGVIATLVKSPDGRKLALDWALTSDRSVAARAMYDDITTDMRPELAKITVPVTVLYAWDAASPFPQASVDALYQANYAALPSKTLIRIDGAFHFIMLDQPARFASEVESFLK